jgi:hypothetical protein
MAGTMNKKHSQAFLNRSVVNNVPTSVPDPASIHGLLGTRNELIPRDCSMPAPQIDDTNAWIAIIEAENGFEQFEKREILERFDSRQTKKTDPKVINGTPAMQRSS